MASTSLLSKTLSAITRGLPLVVGCRPVGKKRTRVTSALSKNGYCVVYVDGKRKRVRN